MTCRRSSTPNKGLANLLSNLKNPTVAGTEQVNGVATTKITGTSSSDDIATLAGAAPEPAETRHGDTHHRLDRLGRVLPPRQDRDHPGRERDGDADHVRLGQAGHRHQTGIAVAAYDHHAPQTVFKSTGPSAWERNHHGK